MKKKRYFHVSYRFVRRNGMVGFGSVTLDLEEPKLTTKAIKAWSEGISNFNDGAQTIIMSFNELEGE